MCTNNANNIKSIFIDYVVSVMGNGVVIGNEIMYGTSGKVADLVILRNGYTYAVEVKSDSDSLYRIESQLQEYQKQFNYVVVVCGPKHAARLTQSLPNGIGLCTILENDKVKQIRRPIKHTRLDKQEMLFSIKTSYLSRMADFPTRGKNADEIRGLFKKKNISIIQKILYDYWLSKMKPLFELYISDRADLESLPRIASFSSPQIPSTS